MTKTSDDIVSLVSEGRLVKPPKNIAANAYVGSMNKYKTLYSQSIRNSDAFWTKHAKAELAWFKPFKKVLEWKLPNAKWFVGGQLNVSYNCIDRHLTTWRRNKAAIIWEGEPGDTRVLTYQDLHRETCKFANGLKKLGAEKGDRVAIYMPMTPEAIIAMLACTRLGLVHTIVFGGFSSTALKDRINDCGARFVVTADGGYRRGQIVALKENVDAAIVDCPTIEKVVFYKRTGQNISTSAKDIEWNNLLADVPETCEPEKLDSEHPLFILYTSGTTGKPKGLLHTTAGYLLGVTLTTKYVFDLKETDVFWCTADVGWITGHSYVTYGPLSNGATMVVYEGAPNHPGPDRFWRIIDKYKVSIFYTAPTAIRSFIRLGDEWPKKHDLSSLRILGSVGEPINPEAWNWYHKVIGGGRCPIVDTWWQTETGAIMMSPLPGAIPQKPGSCTLPFFGIEPEIMTKDGKPVKGSGGGLLVIKKPWPSMARTIYGDAERFQKTYWTDIPGVYFTGDGARRDKDGYYWIMGRVDDVLNVSGHRIGTMEVESSLVNHPKVAEAAVVGRPDEIKGQAVVAFVTLKTGHATSKELEAELKNHVAKDIGAIARPDDIRFSDALPKTRSGKIMRRLLREVAGTGKIAGDTTTLEDFSVLEKLRNVPDED